MPRVSRRVALKRMGVAGAGLALGGVIRGQSSDIVIGGKPVEIVVTSLSPITARITIAPLATGAAASVPYTGALAPDLFAHAAGGGRTAAAVDAVRAGTLVVRLMRDRPQLVIDTAEPDGASVAGRAKGIQRLTFDSVQPTMTFDLPDGPLLGLGEGGAGFDRKGTTDQMRNGQITSRPDGYSLAVNGTRAPIQWLIGTGGWAMFIHQPYGSFDFKGLSTGTFTPNATAAGVPFDIFIVSSSDPATIMREYARISGFPEMPALWTLGYLQSHRTLAGPDEILGIAKTMREKKLPCDGLIYLGTDFCPSGWNTHNGEFTWHPANFPDPKKMIDTIHADHFKVIMHIVIEGHTLTGTVSDPCAAAPLPAGRIPQDGATVDKWPWPPDRQVSCYWPAHKPLMDVGVDAWWPDQGDGFDGPSRLNRHRMYWEGTQLYRPNERPFALHRNASAGVQRYGGYIWSGDVQSQWSTLKAHVPAGINTSLSGLPLWGTDIGGFYGTADYTGELFVRWFQFGAFCPLFRSHGRNWHLHLPWGWDGGDGGPNETQSFTPDPKELHNGQVEPICRMFMNLRYQLLPYLYTALRDAHETGMPIMRALWLHFPTEPAAVSRGDQYMWGPHMLIAPVVDKGATSRKMYLPAGAWVDFWTNERVTGGREIDKAVTLDTMPIFVRAGAILPMGPVKQYVDEPVDAPLALVVYPGGDGTASLYEDDGKSFAHRTGAWMRLAMAWRDASRQLTVQLAVGSRTFGPMPKRMTVRVAGSTTARTIEFTGKPLTVKL
jgi:alpha-glucosidase (family GH31 glycosyl hydrolase)